MSAPESGASPRIPGREPVITVPGGERDVPWQAVKLQRNADGTESAVWEQWLAFSADPVYLALFARWDPGMIIRRHGHYSSHVLTVLEGDMTCGGVHCPAGTHIELPLGASFGPFVAGPQGTRLYEVMMGDPRSWSDEPEVMERVCAEHGVTPLPDPEIELPEWLEDLRSVWLSGAGEGG